MGYLCELSEFVDLQIMKMRSENPSYAIRNTEYHGVNDLLELNHDVTLDRNGNLLRDIAASYCHR